MNSKKYIRALFQISDDFQKGILKDSDLLGALASYNIVAPRYLYKYRE